MQSPPREVYDGGMVSLRDVSLRTVPVGSVVFPSSVARRDCDSRYYLDDLMRFAPNCDVFPALVLPSATSTFVTLLTPTGIHELSRHAHVARFSRRRVP